MKMIKIFLFILLFCLSGCNENKILEEVPLDFLSPENSYVKEEHFRIALNMLYDHFRGYHRQTSNLAQMDLFVGTDAGYDARDFRTNEFSDYNKLTPSHSMVYNRWAWAYTAIFDANVIISRIEQVKFSSESLKNSYIAEARFFRAWFYRTLAHLFGAVPLVLEETKAPIRNYSRASREEVYLQCKADLLFASEHLLDVDKVKDGMLSKAAAFHLLSEILISLGDYQGAVKAASWIIDSPDYNLMTKRFGSRRNFPGDVWRDLFELNNQNRSSGNREGIFVIQVEFNLPGGWGSPTGDADVWERIVGPQYFNFRAAGEGVFLFIGPTTYHGGRGGGFFRPGSLYTHKVWEGNWRNDIRNSDYNILRKYWVDNPASKYYNDTLDFNSNNYLRFFNLNSIETDTNSYIYPFCLKYSQRNNHNPVELAGGKGPLMATTARRSYLDKYAMRLAETYLLRAEAYLMLGQNQAAAADINVVRTRANATPVEPGNVNIDYILDERIRELYLEEFRRITLSRLGLLYERTKKFNPYAAGTVKKYHNLYPIPFREIERNTGSILEQNYGY